MYENGEVSATGCACGGPPTAREAGIHSLMPHADAVEDLNRVVSVDPPSFVPQHPVDARKRCLHGFVKLQPECATGRTCSLKASRRGPRCGAGRVRRGLRLVERLLPSAIDGGGVTFALADIQPQMDADVSFDRYGHRSRPCLFPASPAASACRRPPWKRLPHGLWGSALVLLISGLPMPPALATTPFRSSRLGTQIVPGPTRRPGASLRGHLKVTGPGRGPDDHAVGRCRGTEQEVHLVADDCGRCLAFVSRQPRPTRHLPSPPSWPTYVPPVG